MYGYEIHHGRVARCAEPDWLGVGIRRGRVYGTHWHGLLDNDAVRRTWLADVAAGVEPQWVRGVRRRERRGPARRADFDVMADLLAAHVDIGAVLKLVESGALARPVIASSLLP